MKNKIIITIFMAFIGISAVMTSLNQKSISISERRKLESFPTLIKNGKYNQEFFNQLDDYFTDHFVNRDEYLRLKAYSTVKLFGMKDVDGVYLQDGYLFKQAKTIDEKSIAHFINLHNSLKEEYFKDQTTYFMPIPLKNHYLENNQLDYSYQEMQAQLADIKLLTIDIADLLSLDAYYKTDLHWRQDQLLSVVEAFFEATGLKQNPVEYKTQSYTPFYGAYYSYYGGMAEADTLNYLDSAAFDGVNVYSLDQKGDVEIYDLTALGSIDSYNVFLDGPTSYLDIQNPNVDNGQKLIVVRDSYASSLIPLLIPSFERIQVIDLRYYASQYLDNLELDSEATVLFMYGEELINNSYSLR